MTAAARAGWMLSAAFFATVLSSILHVAHVGILADVLLLVLVVSAAIRPDIGMVALAAAVPVAFYLATRQLHWMSTVGWAETIVCAVITGVSLNRSFRSNRVKADATGLEWIFAAAILFGAIVIASLIAGLGVLALRLGPGFTHAILIQLTHEYFIDIKGFPAVHAGTLLLEGVLLFGVAARIAAERWDDTRFLHRMTAATAASATFAAILNLAELVRYARRGESFLASLIDLATKVRWNVNYTDMNAAGSYFAMAGFVAAALAVRARGPGRIAWAASTITIAAGLWLTSSRIAVLAGLIAPAAVLLVREVSQGRGRALRAAGVAAGALVLLVLIAVLLPQRGLQKSPLLSADVRVGLLQTGSRMIAHRPVFGIGLAEFYPRAAQFSSPDLLAKFPAVLIGENAHNNFMQIAAELGVPGGALFLFLVLAALVTVARRAATLPDIITVAGLSAFVLTWLGGHPLLIPEPGYAFWTLLGAATGSAATPGVTRSRLRWIVPIGLIVIAATLPWRLRATTEDADLEHVAIGLSPVWQVSPDGIKYKEGVGHATLFVSTQGFLISVYPLTDQQVRLELKLGGQVANVVTLEPRRWNDVRLPARNDATSARFTALDLRVLDGDQTAIWVTKEQPLR
jgi:hypothetical protein